MSPAVRYKIGAVVTVVLAAAGVGAWIYLRPSPSSGTDDPLCKMVRDRYGMKCVPLATPKTYDRGALIRTQTTENAKTTTTLPEDYLFAPACVFSPDAVLSAVFQEDPDVSLDFGKPEYTLDRNASAGVELNLPQVTGLKFKAGPKVSYVRKLVLEADA